MTTIAPIETHYAGCRFRSRIEARWAVFLDLLGLRWEYEPQGFDLPSGAYLPDFKIYLGNSYCWWEVKGETPTRRERDLAWDLFEADAHFVYLAHGDIPRNHLESTRITSMSDIPVRWHMTPYRNPKFIGFTPAYDPHQEGVDHPRILSAYMAARSARFEHGERG